MPLRGHLQVDVLSDVLALLEPHGQAACRSELTAPWGLSFSRMAAFFHVIESGTCVLLLPGQRRPLQLGPGDVLLVPRGLGHRMGSSGAARMAPHEEVLKGHLRQGTAHALLRHGGGGARLEMFCGIAGIRNPSGMRMLDRLPLAIHRPGERGRVVEPLRRLVELLLTEAGRAQPGNALATSRLFDLLFIELVRGWIASLPEGGGGWMGALRDPQIGAALAQLHAAPEREWTVSALAGVAGMSRSPFATRFTRLVGRPPLHYLARWRMLLAARILRHEPESVRAVARRVGYDAEEAFSRAFKRDFGLSPAAYRQALRRGEEPPPPR